MTELGDRIECETCQRQAVRAIGAILLGSYLIGGICWGAHEYREHNKDPIAAEASVRERLGSGIGGEALYYGTLPGRRLGYLLASR